MGPGAVQEGDRRHDQQGRGHPARDHEGPGKLRTHPIQGERGARAHEGQLGRGMLGGKHRRGDNDGRDERRDSPHLRQAKPAGDQRDRPEHQGDHADAGIGQVGREAGQLPAVHRDVVRIGLQSRHQADQETAQELVAEHLDAQQRASRRQSRERPERHRVEGRWLQIGKRVQDNVQGRHHEQDEHDGHGRRPRTERPRRVDDKVGRGEAERRRRRRERIAGQAPPPDPGPDERRDGAQRQQHRGRHGKHGPEQHAHARPGRRRQPGRHPAPRPLGQPSHPVRFRRALPS